jgi:5-dehydro-2-deoxygluconokinase
MGLAHIAATHNANADLAQISAPVCRFFLQKVRQKIDNRVKQMEAEFVSGLAGKREFIIFGRAGMDLYADPPGTRTEEATRFTSALGGSAANIAVALVKQGCKAALISAVSQDAVGRFVLRQLEAYGIDTRHVAQVSGEQRTSLAVVETRAENCQSVIYRNAAADFEVHKGQLKTIAWRGYDGLIFTGTSLARELSRGSTHAAIAAAKQAGLAVIMDVDHRPYSWASAAEAAEAYRAAADACDIIIGNDEEFAVIAGGDGLPLARSMAASSGRIVVYKMGAKGAITFAGGKEFETPIFKVEALKPTGAGDAFMGGFISALADGQSVPDAVRRGAATAAIVVTRVGCAPAMPSAAEVHEFIGEQ